MQNYILTQGPSAQDYDALLAFVDIVHRWCKFMHRFEMYKNMYQYNL